MKPPKLAGARADRVAITFRDWWCPFRPGDRYVCGRAEAERLIAEGVAVRRPPRRRPRADEDEEER